MTSIEQQVGQMMMVGFHGLTAPDYILDWLREGRIAGVILFARNIDNPEQVAQLTQQIHDNAIYPAIVAIDQEGGTVSRMREGFTESPSAMALASSQNGDYTAPMMQVLGDEMRVLGINWTYAPVCDITYNRDNPTVGTRSFGSDAETVSQYVAEAVKGFQAGGVAACAKHFPGLGDTAIDTHLALARLDVPVEHLLAHDLLPYRSAISADVASVMVTHTVFTQLDTEYPATLSPVIVKQLLRDELGFDGIVVTDCMEMRAVSDNFGVGESAVLSVLGDHDFILFSHTREMQAQAYDAVCEAVKSGRIPQSRIDDALRRIETFRERFKVEQIDTATIRNDEHLDIAGQAGQAGVVLVKHNKSLPIQPQAGQQVALIEFASYLDSDVVESGGQTGLGQAIQSQQPDVQTLALSNHNLSEDIIEQAKTLAAESHILVLATRNAHLMESQAELAQQLIDEATNTILLCLRNPYDAEIFPSAETILCTNGDSAPSIQATVDALMGRFTPSGKLPIDLA